MVLMILMQFLCIIEFDGLKVFTKFTIYMM